MFEAGDVSDTETNIRPSASGHRFGPDLSCAECGITWEAHQKEPVPCSTDAISRNRGSTDEHEVAESAPEIGEALDASEKG